MDETLPSSSPPTRADGCDIAVARGPREPEARGASEGTGLDGAERPAREQSHCPRWGRGLIGGEIRRDCAQGRWPFFFTLCHSAKANHLPFPPQQRGAPHLSLSLPPPPPPPGANFLLASPKGLTKRCTVKEQSKQNMKQAIATPQRRQQEYPMHVQRKTKPA